MNARPESADKSEIARSREEITDLTLAIARLAGARNLVAARIGGQKRRNGADITDPGRESDLLQRLLDEPIPGLDADAKLKLAGTLIRLATDVQESQATPQELYAATASEGAAGLAVGAPAQASAHAVS